MTKKKLLTILIVAAITASPLTSHANDTKGAAAELYNQLVTQDKGTATTYINEDVKTEEVIAEMINIDSVDNPYDGPYAIHKGTSYNVKTYNTGKMEVTIYNPFTKEDSEKILDEMTAEIDKTLTPDATQKDKLNAIIKYIGKTFKYGKDGSELIDMHNFVEAYNGNKKIVCGQYSMVTLLLCSRYGIDCRIMEGTNHAFNLIRLDGEDKYTAYDLTKTSIFLPAKVGYTDLITGHYTIGRNATKYQIAYATLTNQVPYKLSVTALDIIAGLIISATCIMIIYMLLGLPDRRYNRKRAKKHATKNKAFAR